MMKYLFFIAVLFSFAANAQSYEIVKEDSVYRVNPIEQNAAGEEYTLLAPPMDSATAYAHAMAETQGLYERYVLRQVQSLELRRKANRLRSEIDNVFGANYFAENDIAEQLQGDWVLRRGKERSVLNLKNRKLSNENYDLTLSFLGRNLILVRGLTDEPLEFIMIRDGVFINDVSERILLIKR